MFQRLTSFENDIDFGRLWRIGYVISAVALTLSVFGIVVRGLNLGIDFEGGTDWQVQVTDVSVGDARDTLAGTGFAGAKIQIVGDDTLRVQAEPGDEDEVASVTEALADLAGVDVSDVNVSTVGPTWGEEISDKAQRALVYFFVILAAYMAWRLEWKMAVGALTASAHDLLICVGVYALFQFEITPATVIAFLTILGYSLYDTIVVFDKAHENANRPAVAQRMTYTDLMSLSLNQVLMRSINTAILAMLPVLSMLVVGAQIMGAVTLQEFSVALFVGLLTGAYSSIFVSAPLVTYLKEREPRHRSVRTKLETQAARRESAEVAAQKVGASAGTVSGRPTGPASAPELSGRVIPPRPRKKGRKR